MCTIKNIKLEGYTEKQSEALALNAACLTVKEIANEMGIAKSTVDTHIKNCKEIAGVGLDKELAVRWICHFAGVDFDDIRKQIFEIVKQSTKVAVILLLSAIMLGRGRINTRRVGRERARVEVRARAYVSREFA